MELITIKDACRKLCIGRTKIWALSKTPGFPRLVEVTQGRKAFVVAELDDWIAGRIAARDAGLAEAPCDELCHL